MNPVVKSLVQAVAAAADHLSTLLSTSLNEKESTDLLNSFNEKQPVEPPVYLPPLVIPNESAPYQEYQVVEEEKPYFDNSLPMRETGEYIPQPIGERAVPFSPKQDDIKISIKHVLSIVLMLCCFGSVSIHAQSGSATAKLDTNALLIGDQTKLVFQVTHPAQTTVHWPAVPDTLGKVEIVGQAKVDTLSAPGAHELTERQSLIVTAFDSGSYRIPSFVIAIIKAGGDTLQTIMTDSLLLTVHTILVDTTLAIKDIKAPLNVPFSWREWLPYIMDIVVIAAGIVAFYYYMKKRKKKAPDYKPLPSQPPHEIAFNALRQLEAERLWQNGFVKQYYSSLSTIIRTYIEHRYGIGALESTTDEILSSLRSLSLSGENRERLQQLLALADLVKFAKEQPLPDEHTMSIKHAYVFVETTMPQQLHQEGREI